MEEKKTGNATGAEETGKLFTQEDVNRIISERLGKEREKVKKEQDASFAERERILAERERAFNEKEMRTGVLEELVRKNLPPKLADLIKYSDEEAVKEQFETLEAVFNAGRRTPAYEPQNGECSIQKPDLIREAMGLSKGNHPKPPEGYAFGWNSKTGESAYIDANNKNKPI